VVKKNKTVEGEEFLQRLALVQAGFYQKMSQKFRKRTAEGELFIQKKTENRGDSKREKLAR